MLNFSVSRTVAFIGTLLPVMTGAIAAIAQQQGPSLNAPERSVLLQRLFRTPTAQVFTAPRAAAVGPGGVVLDPRKSIFITDVETVGALSFAAVMDKLVEQGGDTTQSKLGVFRQWWDSAAKAPGTAVGPHCDDKAITQQGFPYDCPRPEAQEAQSDPFTPATAGADYMAVAFSNRFDLINPANPNDCGEARVVFARTSGQPSMGQSSITNRNFIIFEARLPNPKPQNGMDGCRDIQDFWLSLSGSMTASERGTKLRDFYLTGLPAKGVGPVVSIDNYAVGTGQIRTNQFLHQSPSTGFVWTLREFKINRLVPGIRIVPATVKTNPDPSLFSGQGPADLQVRLASRIADNMTDLRGGGTLADEASPFFAVHLGQPDDDKFNGFESNETNASVGSVAKAFSQNEAGVIGTYLTAKIKELKTNTSLSVTDIVQRIQTQTCSGCHEFSNGKPLGGGAGSWPMSLGFTHTSEKIETPPGGTSRFLISDTLKSASFIPARCRLMAQFLGVDGSKCGQVN